MKVDPATTALLLIDVINDFDFAESAALLKYAVPAAEKIGSLKARARALDVPVIYVNDNFGRWQSDFKEQIEFCSSPECKGREITRLLLPDKEDYFVLKPRHSGFYATSLPVLLGRLGSETLILAGFAGDICVLYTANDAYMRDYAMIIPDDCVASETESGNQMALQHMNTRLKARVVSSSSVF